MSGMKVHVRGNADLAEGRLGEIGKAGWKSRDGRQGRGPDIP
jgi:hypothetical protein